MKSSYRESSRLKNKLKIDQSNGILSIDGSLNNTDYKINGLFLVSRDKDTYKVISQNSIQENAEFSYKIILNQLYEMMVDQETNIFDWFIKVERNYDELSNKALTRDDLEVKEIEGTKKAFYYIRLGRFANTDVNNLSSININEGNIYNYLTQKGNLSCILNDTYKINFTNQIESVKKRKNKLIIEGKVFSKSLEISSFNILLRPRNCMEVYKVEDVSFVHNSKETKQKYGLNRYQYKAVIDFNRVNKGAILPEDIYDIFAEVDFANYGERHIERIGNPTFRAKHFLKALEKNDKTETAVINPYYTFKQYNLSLEIYNYPNETFKYLKRALKYHRFKKYFKSNKDIWIVGERPNKAQDTGLAFFRFVRNKYPEKEVYYVIEENSADFKNLNEDKNILIFKSKEHINKVLSASKIISSHHADYLFPTRTPKFKSKVKATKVFIQHGVMGVKNMVTNYGKKALSFDTDIFIVSSDFEKEMIVNDFGYHPEQVFVTGLSRFDELFKNDVKVKNDILIIPTWRDWISTESDFLESDYFLTYKSFVESEYLYQLKLQYNFEIILCLHPNMEKYTEHFNSDKIEVVSMESKNVQELIKSSAMMITDYSSVGFDFSFLHKPLVYFQFDRDRFIGRRPSHLDLDNDLPGEIEFNLDGVLNQIEFYANNGFKVKEEFIEKSNKFINYRDLNSSQRIYNVVENYVPSSENKKQQFIEKPVMADLYKKFRTSKAYFPVMKLFYRFAKYVIPIDRNLILFESGIGKQYADSPKVIYEEINKRGLKYKKVWVYNKNHRFDDLNTIKIKRLSPSYYYYLIRAGYWINNQNFPHYMTKRRGTKYVQTWHGTPLKKMLFDIEDVQGRSEGYKERVGNAVKNWDYLLSPSEYATKCFRSAFHYDGIVLEKGYPRNDIFSAESKGLQGNIKGKLKLPTDKKVILYAPTFRDNATSGNNKFTFDLKLNLEKMYQDLGSEFIVLLRMHVVVKGKLAIDTDYSDFVFNVSNYPDAQDLLLISDILITDYSSMMFDFANTNRPMLFFTYDLEEYRDDIRGFYLDFEKEAPGPLVYDTEQIVKEILRIDKVKEEYREKYKAFQNKFCYLDDGSASERVVDELFDTEQGKS